jgi:hypothetical protein
MNKIKILLMDDNPTTLCYKADLPEVNFIDDEYNEPIQFKGLSKYFELEWLQDLNDVKEFRAFTQKLLNDHGLLKLDSKGYLPDIVLFDYNFSREISNKKNVTQLINNKIALRNNFCTHRVNNDANNDLGITRWSKHVGNNAFGSLAGAILTLDFKENACIGVPTTAFDDGGFDSQNAIEYFEDLLKQDFGNSFSLKGRVIPKWSELIPLAMKLKRDRILTLASEHRIIFDLQNLLSLINGAHIGRKDDSEETSNCFYFQSIFGSRTFLLDALFIDIDLNEYSGPKPEQLISHDKISTRDYEIHKYAQYIFDQFGIKTDDFYTIKEKFWDLWDTFCSSFGQIYELSTLRLKVDVLSLTNDDGIITRLHTLKQNFHLTPTNDIPDELVKSVFEYKEGVLSKDNKRKVVLMLATRLYLNFCLANQDGKLTNELNNKPTEEEYAYVFSPIRSEYNSAPTILESHRKSIPHYNDTANLRNALQKTANNLKALYGNTKGIEPFHFEQWITKNERSFLLSFFNRDLKKIEQEQYPVWLKKQNSYEN